ncbi:MAG: phage head-tail connector protein [Clostridia bacterium]|nr:phage head-tail connector protein [Clostridia bacterium]
MTAIQRLIARFPDAPIDLLNALYAEAEGMILAYTCRRTLPAILETAAVQMTVILYNREGIEGETAHSEGGVSRTMDGLPEEIKRQCMPYRIARIGR